MNFCRLVYRENKISELIVESSLERKMFVKQGGDAFALAKEVLNVEGLVEEYVWVLAIRTSGEVAYVFEVAHGGYNCACVNIPGMLIRVLLTGCPSLLILHNHPSGVAIPSKVDDVLTRNMEKACSLVGLQLLDHVVLGEGDYYSYKNSVRLKEGKIDWE